MKNKCLFGNESSITWGSSLVVNLDRKSATTFSLPGLSIMVYQIPASIINHLVNLPVIEGLFIRYLIVA